MRSTTRALLGGALALPLVIAAAGAASADEYVSATSYAGPDGACVEYTYAHSDEYGNTYYTSVRLKAGPDGASTTSTTSAAEGHGSESGGDGSAWYAESGSVAGPDGAYTYQIGAVSD
ncbi:hypothetical protein [Umezawaea beigongshangensis]|uniref:hypothetical protein n=1 Tax=Umezawaea beigongshangensis TaxID=2780383 RepID=UPI0018F20AE1|nr:hypothetical protein [Umezawaea beigongshangensis]